MSTNRSASRIRVFLLAVVFAGLAGSPGFGESTRTGEGGSGWTQFGGPRQDFRSADAKLAASWPDAGPPTLWERELGGGYSGILVDGERLFTMYRVGDQEAVICLDAKTGETVWEYRYDAAPEEGHVFQFGDGPRATPLISGKRLFAIGVSGDMHALDKSSGELLWKHDLWEEFSGNVLNHGYSSSPVVHGKHVIVLVGGEGQSIVAFDMNDGEVAWKGLDFKNSYSTPQILSVAGQPQLVTFMASEIIGVDPANGKLLWSHPHENRWNQNVNMPVMVDENHLFLSSPQVGAKGLKISGGEEGFEVEEIWSTRKIQFYHVTSVLDGEWVYGSTGTMAPAFMAAINARTGEIAWRKRGFAKANCTYADGRLVILDEEGVLTLATATPDDLTVHSQAELMNKVAWTVPTIVGRMMYVRDQAKIVAVKVG